MTNEQLVEIVVSLNERTCPTCGAHMQQYRELRVIREGEKPSVTPKFVCLNGHPQD